MIDLNFSCNVQLLDDIELNRVAEECNHHVLHNVIHDDWISYEVDRQNDLTATIVFVERYCLMLLLLSSMV